MVLLRLRKNKKVKGSVLAVYLMLYSFVRFIMEFLRTDEFGTGNIRYNQVFAVLVFIGAFIWLIYLTKRSQKAELEADTEDIEPSEYSEIVEKIKKEEQDAESAMAGEQPLEVVIEEKKDSPEAQTSEEVTQDEE